MINTINSTSSTHTYLCIWYTVIFMQVSANFRVVKWHMPALSTFSPKKINTVAQIIYVILALHSNKYTIQVEILRLLSLFGS